MNGRGIDGRCDIHEFQAKRAGGKPEIADVANQSDIWVIDSDIQIGLIIEAGGLIAGGGAAALLLLWSINLVAARRRIKNCRASGENRSSGNHP